MQLLNNLNFTDKKDNYSRLKNRNYIITATKHTPKIESKNPSTYLKI